MRVKLDSSGLSLTKWNEYVVRFLFGGCITAIAGLVAMKFGPKIGGALLAFPAIFPAGATLIEKHEKEKKQKRGLNGEERGRQAASIDAAGAAIGTLGLLSFAVLIWQLLQNTARGQVFLPRWRHGLAYRCSSGWSASISICVGSLARFAPDQALV